MPSFILERTIPVPHAKVWEAAGDFSRSPGPAITITCIRPGDPAKNGAGAERVIVFHDVRPLPFLKPVPAYEKLEAVNPPHSFTYSISRRSPMQYLGVASFYPQGEATRITWDVTFTPKFPGMSKMLAKSIRASIQSYIDALEKIQ
jgi:ligand-binding SRPBCC domain-containing protein